MAHAHSTPTNPLPNWNHAADDYATHRAGPPLSFYRRLEAFGVGLPGQRVLDLGTGTGLLARQFARQGVKAAGLDPFEGMIASARSLAEKEGLTVDFRIAKAEQPPFPDRSFDAITANHCWWYFDAPKVVAEAKRLLVPGSPLVISFFSWLQIADPVVRATEALILRHNPKAPDLGWEGKIPPSLSWAKGLLTQTGMFWYDEAIPYTHMAWRGRVRANRSMGAALPPDAVERADAELAALLNTMAPDPFTVQHRISAYVLVPE